MAVIASIQIPRFSIALMQRDDPELAKMPLILYAEGRQHAIVVAASADTGATPGMPLRQALVRYPGAVALPATPDKDLQVLTALLHLLQAVSPRVAAAPLCDDARIDLDLGHTMLAQMVTFTQRVASQIQTTLQLNVALGVASTRFVAGRAAVIAGAGATVIVPSGMETTFLASQSVLTFPLDAETIQRLQLLGLHTIGDVARLPLDALQAQFGSTGRSLYLLARGHDGTTPIGTSPETPMLSRRARFAGAVNDRALLGSAIERLVAALATQLARGGWAARTIMVTLTLEEGAPWAEHRTLSSPTADQALLTQAFLALSRTATLQAGVEAVMLQLTELVPTVVRQQELFASETGQAQQRDAALERLQARYANSFLRAHIEDPTAALPEQRMRFATWEPR